MTVIYKSFNVKRNYPANFSNDYFLNIENELKYTTYDVEFFKIKYCFISKEGAIYNNLICLFKKSLVGPKHYQYFPLRRRLREVWRYKRILLQKEKKYLVAFDGWSVGHYHWITEFLPRLIFMKNNIREYVLLLPDVDYVRNVGVHLLALLGLKSESIIYLKSNHLYYTPNLFFVSQTALTGYINDKAIQVLKNQVDANFGVNLNPEKKIYITRQKARMRKVLNENEVINYCLRKGFEIVDFDSMPIERQVTICQQSKVMMGIHGAGLTNMLFMSKGSHIIEFRRNKVFVNQCYWHLADAVGHKYYYFFGEPDSDKQIEGDGCNLTINIQALDELLRLIKV